MKLNIKQLNPGNSNVGAVPIISSAGIIWSDKSSDKLIAPSIAVSNNGSASSPSFSFSDSAGIFITNNNTIGFSVNGTQQAEIGENIFNISNSTEFILPSGTTSNRISNPSLGCLRYNSTTDTLDCYLSTGWELIATESYIATQTPKYFYGCCTATTVLSSSPTAIPIGAIIKNDASNYSHSSGSNAVTILIAGWYKIIATVCVQATAGNSKAVIQLYNNGNTINYATSTVDEPTSGNISNAIITALHQFSAGDILSLSAWKPKGGMTVVSNNTSLLLESIS